MKKRSAVKLALLLLIGVLAISVAGATPTVPKDKDKTATRMLTGKVLDKGDNAITNAAVAMKKRCFKPRNRTAAGARRSARGC